MWGVIGGVSRGVRGVVNGNVNKMCRMIELAKVVVRKWHGAYLRRILLRSIVVV